MIFSEDADIPRNPVVLRALNQARKVMNALVQKYGSPHAVHIEMARDLSRPLDERREVEKAQKEFHDQNEKDKDAFSEHFGIAGSPKGGDFEKWRLYREQQGKCAYSVEPIDLIACSNRVMWKLIMPCPTHVASTTAKTIRCWFTPKKIATRVIVRHLNTWAAQKKAPVGDNLSPLSNLTKLSSRQAQQTVAQGFWHKGSRRISRAQP